MIEVVFHPEARAEYWAGWNWYHSRSPQAAARFENELERVLDLIRANPKLFPKYEDDFRYASLGRFPFSVIYELQPDCIYIIAVAHSARAEGYWRTRS